MSVREAYDDHDAIGLAALVAARELSAEELLDEALRRVDERNPRLNAVCNVFEDRARTQLARRLPPGPVSGIPFLLKDLGVDLAGEVTSNGSRFFADAIATRTSYIVERYLASGLVVFGKSSTPEMGLNVSTEPVLFGPTHNPWDITRSAGGSSGGAGAAVAGGIVPVAHATDGGGSIRIPASANGLFGLKPTRGRTPMGPPYGEGWNGLSHGHVLTRSVRDSAALLDIAAGSTLGEPYAAPAAPAGGFLAAAFEQPGRLRIGCTTDARPGIDVDPECKAAVAAAAELLGSLGHHVVPVTLPVDWDALQPAFGVITSTHIGASIRARAREIGREPRPADLETVTRAAISRAGAFTAFDYVDAVQTIQRIGRQVGAFFAEVDMVLTPTLGALPPALGVMYGNIDENDSDAMAEWGARASRIAAFLGLMNATGQPAMSVPLHWTADGIPVGVQLMGRFGDEATLLALGRQLEEAAPWWHRRPVVTPGG